MKGVVAGIQVGTCAAVDTLAHVAVAEAPAGYMAAAADVWIVM